MTTMKSLLVALCVIGVALAEQSSPLFMWNANSEAKPALSTISQSEFTQLITPLLAENALVVFMEKNLNNRDFLCTTIATSKSCFARLQNVSGKKFYTSVEKPIETLRSIGGTDEYNYVDRSGRLSKPLKLGNGDINFVKFEDDQISERGASLELHDSIIASLTSKLDNKNVIFVYTSEPSPASNSLLKRERRATAASSKGYVFRDGSNLLVFYSSLTIDDGQGKKTLLDVSSMTVTVSNASALSVRLNAQGSPLTFDVVLSGGYFYMKNVAWNNVHFRSNDVYSPTDFSYFCGNLTLYGIGTAEETSSYTLKWNSLQFQAPFGSTKDADFIFGDPWHCVGFFTGGILSGLLIVALLLTITFVGVCWMMDINTMDRFDDPKGKTITINASE